MIGVASKFPVAGVGVASDEMPDLGEPMVALARVGGTEASVVAYLIDSPLSASFIAWGADQQGMATHRLSNILWSGQPGRDSTRLDLASADQEFPPLIAGAELVILIANLSNTTGTTATPILARAARQTGAQVLGLAFMPLAYELKHQREHAQQTLARLQDEGVWVAALSISGFIADLPGRISTAKAYGAIDKSVRTWIDDATALCSTPIRQDQIDHVTQNFRESKLGRHSQIFTPSRQESS